MNAILEKLKEKSTWAGIFTVLGAFGIALKPELSNSITATGLAIAGLVSVIIKEEKK